MKKVLLTLSIFGIILFLFIKEFKAEFNNKDYNQKYHTINFKNLNSKNINELFKDINGTIIEIEVETLAFTKKYKFDTVMTLDIETKLIQKVTEDLIKLNKRELAANYQINGVKITKMNILCTGVELEVIKNKTETE